MTCKRFLTIVGRWKRNSEAADIDGWPAREQGLAMGMFIAGFVACLEAQMEISEYEDDEAMQLLSALHAEAAQLEGLLRQTLGREKTN